MCHITHCRFYDDFAYDTDLEGAANCLNDGQRLAEVLGDRSVLFMGNHGVLVAAANPALAFDQAYYLERACMHQVRCPILAVLSPPPPFFSLPLLYFWQYRLVQSDLPGTAMYVRSHKPLGFKSAMSVPGWTTSCITARRVRRFITQEPLFDFLRPCQMLAMATGKTLREFPDDVSRVISRRGKARLQHFADIHLNGVFGQLIREEPTFLES